MRIKQLAAPAALADVSLAALSSVVTVLGTIALAAMIFSGLSPKAVPLAFLSFVAGTALSGLFIALFSQFQCNLSGAQDEPAAILAIFGKRLGQHGRGHRGRRLSRRCSPSLFSQQPASDWFSWFWEP